MARYSIVAHLLVLVAVISAENSTHSLCKKPGGECGFGGTCTGRACLDTSPGHKNIWPELKGVSAIKAKEIIERENPHVKAWIFPYPAHWLAVICSKRVILLTPKDDCPNGPVLNSPYVG
ncbi:hypothetical protein Vadar_004528 [Vaccinium darrowii]|uniref:Uncharacterized protein n=1 Tax=Vaccinium darrowii TaxID=229202 RepID=A0ACB7WXV1_9ERIC|nr:hypothetical protein Vadar_004528 [Vaccinium darrowii]